jgi:hypothetical protein
MKNNDDDRNLYLPHRNTEKDRLIVEVPIEAKMPYPDKLPSGYDPVQSIGLEGRAFRGLAGGRMPWWILATGWFFFGGFAALALSSAIASGLVSSIPLLLVSSLPLAILWRGTAAKIAVRPRKQKR